MISTTTCQLLGKVIIFAHQSPITDTAAQKNTACVTEPKKYYTSIFFVQHKKISNNDIIWFKINTDFLNLRPLLFTILAFFANEPLRSIPHPIFFFCKITRNALVTKLPFRT